MPRRKVDRGNAGCRRRDERSDDNAHTPNPASAQPSITGIVTMPAKISACDTRSKRAASTAARRKRRCLRLSARREPRREAARQDGKQRTNLGDPEYRASEARPGLRATALSVPILRLARYSETHKRFLRATAATPPCRARKRTEYAPGTAPTGVAISLATMRRAASNKNTTHQYSSK
jgi:hypothetical protein